MLSLHFDTIMDIAKDRFFLAEIICQKPGEETTGFVQTLK